MERQENCCHHAYDTKLRRIERRGKTIRSVFTPQVLVMKVNGYEITQEMFAYDGCHKIYLLDSQSEQREAMEKGYEIHHISELETIFEQSCALRFISTWDLIEYPVSQFEPAIFEY